MAPPSRRFKIFITVWAFFENLLFSGLRAGWPALTYILKQERIYSHLCTSADNETTVTLAVEKRVPIDPGFVDVKVNSLNLTTSYTLDHPSSAGLNGTRTCAEQDAVFHQCFTVATALMALSALLYGQLNYKYGIRTPRLVSVFVFSSGCLCIAFIQPDSAWLIFPGYLLISAGGMALYLTNNQISYLYSTGSAGVVGLLCGALEASSFIQTLIKMAYEHDVSLRVSYLTLSALYLLTLVSTFCLLPKKFIPTPGDSATPSTAEEQQYIGADVIRSLDSPHDCCQGNRRMDDAASGADSPQSGLVQHVIEGSDVTNPRPAREGSDKTAPPTPDRPILPGTPISHVTDPSSPTPDYCQLEDHVTSLTPGDPQKKTLLQCLGSRTFILYLFWASVVQVILSMCLGTFNPWLEFVTHNRGDQVSRFTDLLFYSMLASPVLSLLIGLGMDAIKRRKQKGHKDAGTLYTSIISLAATSVLGVVMCALVITCQHDVIILASVFLVIFRTALYSCGTAFLRIMYPTEYFGILCGIMSVMSGGFSFLQYPLFLWVQVRNQAWMEVFGFLGILGLVSLIQPAYLLWKYKQLKQ
ncbi:large neutral amino acids transporter small subunit 4-like [Physella acuta]|uniref:large neutral amino acids transporter small subunit 4-like n=1 Tax=Physella acuta TaxID=109671 RepID=UPI0027DE3FB9|nr:large neutral amino acids transporter small subunit 4-like [Physella acuta]